MSYRLVSKLIRGHACYYAVRSARVNGKPRNVDQVYLGKVDDLVALRQGALTPTTVRTRRFGAVAALWQLAGDLDLVATLGRHCPQPRSPARSVGTYLVLAAINRVLSPRSRRGFAEWYETTAGAGSAGYPPTS